MCPCVCFVDLDIVPNALTHSHTSCLLTADKEEEEMERAGRGGGGAEKKKVKRKLSFLKETKPK